MLSESSIHSPPGPASLATARYCRNPCWAFQDTMPLYVPRDAKYRVPFESTAGPSVLPQLPSEPSNSASMLGTAGAAGGFSADDFGSDEGTEHPASINVANNTWLTFIFLLASSPCAS